MSLITGGIATLVPCVTNASASLSATPTTGGGGGGGGITPNPVFSTVTTQLDANFGGSASCYGLTVNSALGTPATLVAGANGVLSISNGANCSFLTNCGNISNGANAVTISSINVSTINGAAPGGGGSIPANLTVSTLIAANATNVLNGNNPNLQLRSQGSSGSSFQIITVPGVATGLKIDQGAGQVSIQNADLVVSTINGAAPGLPPAISVSSITNLSSINIPATGVLTVGGIVQCVGEYLGASAISTAIITGIAGSDVTISTLQVSTINGSAYPPASSGSSVGFSTIQGGNASTIQCPPGGATTLCGFSTINGNGYSVSFQAQLQTFNGTFTDTHNVLGLTTTSGGATQIITNQSAPYLSTLSAAFDLPQIGGCTNLIADGSFVRLQVYNNTPSNITITLSESYSINFGVAG